MANFPHYQLKNKLSKDLWILHDGGKVEDRKYLDAAASVFSPVILDTVHAEHVTVAASGVDTAAVHGLLLQKVRSEDPTVYSLRLPNSDAYAGDPITLGYGRFRAEMGKDLYTGTLVIGESLGWNGTKYFKVTNAAKAILVAETGGTGGSDRLRVKVLL